MTLKENTNQRKSYWLGYVKVFLIIVLILWAPSLLCRNYVGPILLYFAFLGVIIVGALLITDIKNRITGKGDKNADMLVIYSGVFFACVLVLAPSITGLIKDFREKQKYDFSREVSHNPRNRDAYRVSVYRSKNNPNDLLLYLDRSVKPDLVALGFNRVTISSDSIATVHCQGEGDTWGSNIPLTPGSGMVVETGQAMECPFSIPRNSPSELLINLTVDYVYAVLVPPAPAKEKTGYVTKTDTETFDLLIRPNEELEKSQGDEELEEQQGTDATLPFPDEPQWQLVVTDSFDDNTNDWPVGLSKEGGGGSGQLDRSIENGKYRWSLRTSNRSVYLQAWPELDSPADFLTSIDARWVSGSNLSPFGIVFRKKGDEFYTFYVRDSGSFAVYLHKNGWTSLIGWTKTSAYQPGTSNRLTVRAEGSNFDFWINGQYVGKVENNQLARGSVGVTLEDAYSDAEVEFDDFELRSK